MAFKTMAAWGPAAANSSDSSWRGSRVTNAVAKLAWGEVPGYLGFDLSVALLEATARLSSDEEINGRG